MVSQKRTVVFVPGGVNPAAILYGQVVKLLGDEIDPILKDLELYAHDAPPADYSLKLEADGIGRAADAAAAQRFDLVGYSGGASCCLAFVALHPERVRSLAVFEPAWIGPAVHPEDQQVWSEMQRAMTLPPQEQMEVFMRAHMRPGVPPPKPPAPDGPPPPWMARRPAGLKAMAGAFNTYRLDLDRLKLLEGPVYYGYGSLSSRYFEREGQQLAGYFKDIQLEEYAGRSHFDPPQRTEPERFANALRKLWERAGAA